MATSSGTSGNSGVPWHLAPTFRPGDTDVNEYSRRLQFLAGIWPKGHLSQLAPRACLLCEGTAFAKVVRLDAEKLKVSSDEGVKLLVQTLGGVWGQSKLESKYERFEKAIYTTTQKNDESNTSYLARHEVQFEEMVNMGATLEEMRAYILIRNSNLPSEDKKKIIVDSNGQLEYRKVTNALQLLGSKFFSELQSGSKANARLKTYDVNLVDDEEEDDDYPEEAILLSQDYIDDGVEALIAEGDSDALLMQSFEESLVDSLQSDGELATCYNSYLEARRRVTEKTKSRGFWGTSKGNHAPSGLQEPFSQAPCSTHPRVDMPNLPSTRTLESRVSAPDQGCGTSFHQSSGLCRGDHP